MSKGSSGILGALIQNQYTLRTSDFSWQFPLVVVQKTCSSHEQSNEFSLRTRKTQQRSKSDNKTHAVERTRRGHVACCRSEKQDSSVPPFCWHPQRSPCPGVQPAPSQQPSTHQRHFDQGYSLYRHNKLAFSLERSSSLCIPNNITLKVNQAPGMRATRKRARRKVSGALKFSVKYRKRNYADNSSFPECTQNARKNDARNREMTKSAK